MWANLKGHLANLAVRGGIDHLAAVIKHHLKRQQYRPDLLDGIIAQTELILETRTAVGREASLSMPEVLCEPKSLANRRTLALDSETRATVRLV